MTTETSTVTEPSVVAAQQTTPVAIIGFGWMGRVHAQAYSRVRHHYPRFAQFPDLVAIADDVPGRAAEAARQFGARSAVTDWRAVVDDPDIRAVSVTAPNFLHREIGTAVVAAGKHLWIEKPVGLSVSDALAVARAAEAQGVTTAVGFNYRNAPAVAAARELIAAGELGEITHARFYFLSDYAAHPDGALSWRFQRARGGNGVLGDLASHGVDLVRYLLGEVESVVRRHRHLHLAASRPDGSNQWASAGQRRPPRRSGERRLRHRADAARIRRTVRVGSQPGFGG